MQQSLQWTENLSCDRHLPEEKFTHVEGTYCSFLALSVDKETIHGTSKMPVLQKFLTEFIRLNLIIKVP
jgi:hypothetical protein